MHLDPEFAPLLAAFDLDDLDRSANVIYGAWSDGRLGYVNEAWRTFARENGDPDLGEEGALESNLWRAIPPVLDRFYREGMEWARESGQPWSHTYECSSPTVTRIFRMTVYGLLDGRGVLVVNSLLAACESPPGAAVEVPPQVEEAYRNEHGQVIQCAHCRRVRFQRGESEVERWDWVPRWVHISPANTSHGLCGVCNAYHYGAFTH